MFTIPTCKECERAISKDNDEKKARRKDDYWELDVEQSVKISRLSWISKSKSLLALSNTEKSSDNVA